uniref:TIR domain-containing protein n=1 Tax=Knipowitschia caucasica TaxID=637954 RepID=A0AAV2MJC8_KNICA
MFSSKKRSAHVPVVVVRTTSNPGLNTGGNAMRDITAVFWTVLVLVKLQLGALSSERFVDLSNRNLSTVPSDLPHTVEHLDLSCNRIRRLTRGAFTNTTQLRFLNVSWNNLETIDPESEWCHYELYFATHQRLVRGPDSVVLVLLEPLPEYLIPSKYHQLKSMMRRHTYLEWPPEKAKQRLFWANLRAALQSDIPSAPVTELED